MEKKITLISNSTIPVSVVLPSLHFTHDWPSKGAKFAVTDEIFEQMNYDPGCRYMLETGILYTEDMEAKKEVGLEPVDAVKPVNIIILTDAEKEKLLNNKTPLWQFKETYFKLGPEEMKNLANYAIEHELIPSQDICQIIEETTGKRIIRAIEIARQDKEEVKEDNK